MGPRLGKTHGFNGWIDVLSKQHRFFRSVLMAADLTIIVIAVVAAYFLRFKLLADLIPPKDAVVTATLQSLWRLPRR